MSPRNVLDCEVIIGRTKTTAGQYVVDAHTSAGPATTTLALDLSDAETKRLLALVGDDGPDLESREALGKRLFQAVFHDEVHTNWQRVRGRQDAAKDCAIRLRLWIEPPEIAELPWELLWDGEFLGARADLFLSRYLPGPESASLPVPERLRVLVVVCSPTKDLTEVSAEAQTQLRNSLNAAAATAHVEHHWLVNPSIDQVMDELRKGYHAFHFLGHGAANSLYWVEPNGAGRPLDAQELGQMILGLRDLRFVVLNACNSAQAGPEHLFSGVGPTLVRKGIPAVVAMQYPVRQSTAGAFNSSFYTSLGQGDSVDEAVTAGRQRLTVTALLSERDWSTPVLYLGTRSGRLLFLGGAAGDAVLGSWEALQASAESQSAVRDLKEWFRELARRLKHIYSTRQLERHLEQMRKLWVPAVRVVEAANKAGQLLKQEDVQALERDWRELNSNSWDDLMRKVKSASEAEAPDWLIPFEATAKDLSKAFDDVALGGVAQLTLKMDALLARGTAAARVAMESAIEDATGFAGKTLDRIVES